MAGGFTTGSQELLQAATRMENTNEQLQADLKQLAGIVESTQGAWKGAAASAFNTLTQRFIDDANKLNKSLNDIAESVTGNAKAYQKQEDEAQQSLSSITHTLGG